MARKCLLFVQWEVSRFTDVIGAAVLYIEESDAAWVKPCRSSLRCVATHGLHTPYSRPGSCPVILWPRSEKRSPALTWLGAFTNCGSDYSRFAARAIRRGFGARKRQQNHRNGAEDTD